MSRLTALTQWLLSRVLAVVERPLGVSFDEPAAADVIVLLGATCRRKRPGRFAAERAHAAAALLKAGVAPRILVTGGKPEASGGVSEAECLAQHLVELGVSRQRLVLEEASRNTEDNAAMSAAIALPAGWKRALLVTQGWHAKRALAAFRRAGFDARVVRVPLADALDAGETYRHPARGLFLVAREYLAWTKRVLER